MTVWNLKIWQCRIIERFIEERERERIWKREMVPAMNLKDQSFLSLKAKAVISFSLFLIVFCFSPHSHTYTHSLSISLKFSVPLQSLLFTNLEGRRSKEFWGETLESLYALDCSWWFESLESNQKLFFISKQEPMAVCSNVNGDKKHWWFTQRKVI